MIRTTDDLTDIDRQFADFVCRLAATREPWLWQAAALVSNAAGRGSVCLDLAAVASGEADTAAPDAATWGAQLRSLAVVGEPGTVAPLVLDGGGRLYLHRLWEAETRLAERLLALAAASVAPDEALLAAGLRRLFPQRPEGEPDWQRLAALVAVCRRLAIISGGPGTGKTSTVVKVIALLLEQSSGDHLPIALAAPTGKAAARLAEAIRTATAGLDISSEVRGRIPTEVATLHRLLGYTPRSGTFRYGPDSPLPVHVVIVDEASMVDLPLMARLVDALPADARLILLGDKDQLASVEAGAVLGDICDTGQLHGFSPSFRGLVARVSGEALPAGAAAETSAPLADSLVVLTKSYRFRGEGGIGAFARLVNEGRGEDALALAKGGSCDDLLWRDLPASTETDAAFRARITSGYGDYLAQPDPASALEAFGRFRILCAFRQGTYGVEGLNAAAAAALGFRGQSGSESWYAGRPVMIAGNDYGLRLFNGDTGIILADPAGSGRLYAHFPDPAGGVRRLVPLRLPAHETAFAMTVHKSQGSEFERVLLMLPDRPSEIVTRELLYTAVTRARVGVEIWGRDDVFLDAVSRRITRRSGLRERLWGDSGTSGRSG